MAKLDGKRIAILSTHGFEQSELEVPLSKLRDAGATVEVISPEEGEINGWDKKDWGNSVKVDKALIAASVDDYDALVLPGGQINPDLLRTDENAVKFVRDFFNTKKPLAAICHAPWLLIEAGVAEGRDMTSYHSIATDVKNAGANWQDKAVVVDDALITSRNPDDLDAFVDKIIEEVLEGKHEDRSAA
ncbi:type 1 glutamine amidotransferase domain-containing protein [Pseudohoeflea coraliihabitans]|uniref:Type 1 glutamine amidotransferase n=1 Tax=Pseudohoeflea coraliihabitans TaxID=2860393 RepID=A0ABS6WSL3_9HYPH|nr:type 1 glutamine amidotransferase domain-containing protein [Pseudohoeflea sp. DP4N28-3]MBW3098946.1 type 1 glutamine amidotransferase [Pseudohoeflea sp. DP4N28-3]